MPIILANGNFPSHPIPLSLLGMANHVVCCDGAFLQLLNSGLLKDDIALTIVGDGDSLVGSLRERYAHCFVHIPDQDTNDLTKTVRHCVANGATGLVILGATGLREDHTLGNISLLADYAVRYPQVDFRMVSDYGTLTPVVGRRTFVSFPRQQVSLFTFSPEVRVTVSGLEYPVQDRPFANLWQGTLNAALADSFEVESVHGPVLVYQTHEAKE